MPPKTTYLILGDLVSKGKNSIEVVCLLYALKGLHPNKVFLLRGEQETAEPLKKGGFKTEVKYRFDASLYKELVTNTHSCIYALFHNDLQVIYLLDVA